MSDDLDCMVIAYQVDKLKSRLKTEYRYSGTQSQCVSWRARQAERDLIVVRNTDRAFTELDKRLGVKGLYVE